MRFCRHHKIEVIAYSPLGRGKILSDSILAEIANKHNKTPAQVCLRWFYQKGISSIPKTSSIDRLKENIGIFDFPWITVI